MIYLDHNATTPVDPRVGAAMHACLGEVFGNPSSSHAAGQAALAAVEVARGQVAQAVDCQPGEVVWTSGGTEADLLAILGRVLVGQPGRVVISAVEHEAVAHAAELAARWGSEVVRVAPERSGRVDPARFVEACTPETRVASLMLASNETGVVQPVEEVAAVLHDRRVPLHTDAVQAVGKLPVSFVKLGVDLLSLSAHKFGGPKGAGALIVRRGLELAPLQGGPQEGGRRGGTHGVPGLVGLGHAASLLGERLVAMHELGRLRDALETELKSRFSDLQVHGAAAPRVPNTALVGFPAVDAGALVVAADLAGVCVSRGSACHSGADQPSAVLAAMGVPDAVARGTLRLSLGVGTTQPDLERAVDVVARAVERQRVGTAG